MQPETTEFYTRAELRAGQVYKTASGSEFMIQVNLPQGLVYAYKLNDDIANAEVMDPDGMFVKPVVQVVRPLEEIVKEWWSAKFNKNLTTETFEELSKLFVKEEAVTTTARQFIW